MALKQDYLLLALKLEKWDHPLQKAPEFREKDALVVRLEQFEPIFLEFQKRQSHFEALCKIRIRCQRVLKGLKMLCLLVLISILRRDHRSLNI